MVLEHHGRGGEPAPTFLRGLGAGPHPLREARAWVVGRALGLLCRLCGWFLPMYAAGRLESRNVREYEDSARFARGCGRLDLLDCLLTMAEVEWEHEHYFRTKVETHPWTRRLGLWPAPPPKDAIRAAYPPVGDAPT